MKTLADVPVTPLETIEKLAALAPPAAAKETEKPPAPKGRGDRGGGAEELGPLDLERYLGHFGIAYKVKARGSRTLYQIDCLFDPSHKAPDAFIQQDESGRISYSCSHASCKGLHTWAEARARISGEKPVAEFCRNYDPDRKPPKKARQKGPEPSSASPPASPEEHQGGDLSEYLSVSAKGRVSFNPSLFADFLALEFAPLVNEGEENGGLFYRYDPGGLWKILPASALGHRSCEHLGDYAKTARINDALSLLVRKSYRSPEELAPDPMWLNLRNCMLNVESMETRPHAPEFRSRVQLPIDFDKEAKCPLWEDTLIGIFADDLDKVMVLQEFMGYCLYPKIIFPCAMFGIGKGGNGKGTVQNVLETMLGDANVCHISLQRMEEKFGPVELKDKLLNACGETSTQALEVTRFKEICAADKVQAEVKYKSDVIYRPIAKHYISMNAFPGIKDKTDAFFRRIIVMEFKQQFEGERDDTTLKDRLMGELNGIFMWALEGLKRVLKNKAILQPEGVLQAKRRMRAWINPVITFADECLELGPEQRCNPPELYKVYTRWCEDGKATPMGKQKFYEQILTNFQVKKARDHGATREHFAGVSIREDVAAELNKKEEKPWFAKKS